jgi:hypothetical protein
MFAVSLNVAMCPNITVHMTASSPRYLFMITDGGVVSEMDPYHGVIMVTDGGVVSEMIPITVSSWSLMEAWSRR